MRIAQIAPLFESVPPRLYGGTERVVHYLTEEFVRLGHDVTLFASGDSQTSAELVPVSPTALRLDPDVKDPFPYLTLTMERVRQRADEFDILHFHTDYFHFPLFRGVADKTVTTLHGRLDLSDLWPLYKEFPDMPLVSISNYQRLPMPKVRWLGTVYHGLPLDAYSFRPNPQGKYLAFLGRICPEKRPDRAIEIARQAGIKLKIAAKVDDADVAYFENEIVPLLGDPLVEFIGEIGEDEKAEFLGNALAMLFPIDWPEPFGLVMIEAMACGTPVIAFRCGSVPEVIEHGATGFIVDSVEEAVAAVGKARTLNRRHIRQHFETRFSVDRMAADYLVLYERLKQRGTITQRAA